MLSIGSMGGQSLSYYTELAREDYYLRGGEPPGTWLGKGARALGLSGTVDKEAFRNVFLGFSPDGQQQLVRNAGKVREGNRPGHHPGWDLTFSAPKSVSALWALSSQKTRVAIERCHREAVEDALKYLEETALVTKRGSGGAVREQAEGLVCAIFPHGTSRAQDPQLHSHCLVMNMAPRADKSWGTLLGRPLFQAKMTAGALYRASLSAKLEQSLGLAVHREKATFELSCVPKALLDHFSTRRKQILSELEARGEQGPKAAATAARFTRDSKRHLPRQMLFEKWRLEAAAKDLTIARDISPPSRSPRRELREALAVSFAAVSKDQSYFSERQLIRRLAEEAQGRGLPAEDIRGATEKYLSKNRELVALGKVGTERFYSTRALLKTEQAMLSAVQASKGNTGHTISPERLLAAIAQVEKRRGHELSEEQHLAAAHITLHPGSVKAVQGAAGTGKTVLLEAAREAWERAGFRVFGACIAGKAARTLQAESGISSDTIAKRLVDLDRSPKREGAFSLDARTVLVIDEAGMVDTPQMARLIDEARRAGAKLVLVGDKDQLPPIGPGGAFPRIMKELGAATLSDVRRQKEEWARAAAKQTAQGKTRLALAQHEARGLLCLEPSREDAMRRLVSDWSRENKGHPEKALILTGTRADAAALNRLAQAARKEAGELGRGQLSLDGESLLEGDRVLFSKRSRALELENGDTGTVLAVNSRARQLYVQLDRGPKVLVDLSLYDSVGLGYAATTHKAQGQTTERAYVLLGGPMQSRSLSYVQLSRARLQTRLYADRPQGLPNRTWARLKSIARVADQMATERPKELASDLALRVASEPPLRREPEPASEPEPRFPEQERDPSL